MPEQSGRLMILHHAAMQKRGGAQRVAKILRDRQQDMGHDARMSFEIAEEDLMNGTPAEKFGDHLQPGQIPHLHASTNWRKLLRSIPVNRPTLITLHDCRLITGGCPFPLDCKHFAKGCADPCPRNFPSSEDNRRSKREAIDALKPTLVSPSRWLAKLAREALPGQKVRVIPNGIPWPERVPDKQSARAKLGIHPQARVALFAAHGGMKAAYKAGDAWPLIWRELRKKLPGVVGFAAGGDTAGEHEGLKLWPYVDREKLGLLMAAADCLAYPTLADNHSLLILEAMAAGLPVAAPPVGGVPEQIQDGRTGILCNADPEAFAVAVAELLQQPARIREIGHTAFDEGAKRFTDERMAKQYAPLYQQNDSGL
ncbi:glycosyltransferase [Salidesulfovibrio brasiliensis]|uniref:glycosyltransferase n=1 Tax=Salidesulfovibrio brasiliensis TaxID=221711 RepID=UPI000AA3F115|nr:glycosyltransferase [Salidesulfovibrio brasiliensis]